MAGNPRIYGHLVTVLGKYSKFAGAGEKAGVRQALAESESEEAASAEAASAEAASAEQAPAAGEGEQA